MKVCLLYPERDWNNEGRYEDEKAIIQDLGLGVLFRAAAREIELEEGKVKLVQEGDDFIEKTMQKVITVPLRTEGEILYRQEILRDCIGAEDFIVRLYELSSEILLKWDRLGRREKKSNSRDAAGNLVTEIHVLRLFVTGLSELKKLFAESEGRLRAAGFLALRRRLSEEFPDRLEEELGRILKDVSFFAAEKEQRETVGRRMVQKLRIVLSCSMGAGLKPENFRLEDISTEWRKKRSPDSTIGRVQEYISSLTTDSFSVRREAALAEQVSRLEYEAVYYVLSCCEPFLTAAGKFFDQLRLQAAFYRGAVTIEHYFQRFHIQSCYPTVGSRENLRFQELQEPVMGIEQRIEPVGNTCDIRGKMLLIVTGANQGGKSTFLRSIGIAQVMMQSGLTVAAGQYESGLFPSLFTHFTRREDSAMNSGRLDEELGRMSRIVDQLGKNSMVLLNESFASTTEKDGSVIAYDIVRALTEAGVKVLTVTHLLSFARQMYKEAAQGTGVKAEFLSAQRMEDGKRTFRMIPHEPELTSFGLDLYDEIIGK